MPPRYEVRLRDQAGAITAVLDTWRSLSFTRRVNSPGSFRFEIDDNDERTALFALDAQLEIRRSWKEIGLDWYTEFEGLHRTPVRQMFGDDLRTFTSYGVGYLHLLARRIIAYHAGTDGSRKKGAADVVMKEFVDENAGPGAGSPPRLLRSGVTQGLSLAAQTGLGDYWEGARAYQNLLEVLQGIADRTGMDFDLVGTGPATFQFRTYDGQRGEDRRALNINTATGLNPAGNAPVIFSLAHATMREPAYSFGRTDEITAAFAMGRGEQENRDIVEVNDPARIADSPWNRIEIARNGSMEETDAALAILAEEALFGNQGQETFSFQVLQQPNLAYGLHYGFGDLVTARFLDIERHKQITAVTISVSEGDEGERISVTFSDVA